MDIKQFLEGIRFSYLQPYESIPEDWNITKSLNNPIFPEDDSKIRNLLRDILLYKYLNPDYSFTIAGILNKIVSLMDINNHFIFLGNNLAYFHAAIAGNGEKLCMIANQTISKSTCRRLLHPCLKSHHLLSNNNPIYCMKNHKKYGIKKIGVLFTQGTNCKLLKAIEKRGLFSRGSIIICTGMNYENLYNQTMDFVTKSRPATYRSEILLFQQTNKDSNHPTYWDGIFCMRFI
ncbi:MAG: hypothetical protein ACFFDY_00590 [Candidatus Thorarchaeota archaeon]